MATFPASGEGSVSAKNIPAHFAAGVFELNGNGRNADAKRAGESEAALQAVAS